MVKDTNKKLTFWGWTWNFYVNSVCWLKIFMLVLEVDSSPTGSTAFYPYMWVCPLAQFSVTPKRFAFLHLLLFYNLVYHFSDLRLFYMCSKVETSSKPTHNGSIPHHCTACWFGNQGELLNWISGMWPWFRCCHDWSSIVSFLVPTTLFACVLSLLDNETMQQRYILWWWDLYFFPQIRMHLMKRS